MDAKIGIGKVVITPTKKDVLFMGYAHAGNVFKSVATDIHARAIIWMQDNLIVSIFVQLEINYITNNLYSKIFEDLSSKKIINTRDQLFICANHTHSAPGGYGEFLYYEVPTPGFQQEIFDSYTNGAISAIEEAYKNLCRGEIQYNIVAVPKDKIFGCNRSLNSHLANDEFKSVVKESLPDQFEAIDRNIYQLIFKHDGKISIINWLGVHTTSIPNYMTQIHFDNKGYAAQFFEEKYKGVAIFAQGSSGDVSPNYVWDENIKQMRGPHLDPDMNARENGKIQYETAVSNLDGLDVSFIQSKYEVYDFSSQRISSFKTAEPCFGVAFAAGTQEGPGISALEQRFLRTLSKFLYLFSGDRELLAVHGPKDIFIAPNSKRVLNLPFKLLLPIGSLFDPLIKSMKNLLKMDKYKYAPKWYDTNLPVHTVKTSAFILIGIPFEITTMAAKRVREMISKEFKIENVIISSYTNAYAGYITTPEEYSLQYYEGGHTVFGKDSLPILIELIKRQIS